MLEEGNAYPRLELGLHISCELSLRHGGGGERGLSRGGVSGVTVGLRTIDRVAVLARIVRRLGSDIVGVTSIGGRGCLMMMVVVGGKSAVCALPAARLYGRSRPRVGCLGHCSGAGKAGTAPHKE